MVAEGLLYYLDSSAVRSVARAGPSAHHCCCRVVVAQRCSWLVVRTHATPSAPVSACTLLLTVAAALQVETTGKLGGPGSVAVFEYPDSAAREEFRRSRNPLTVLARFVMRAMWVLSGFGHEPMKFGGWEAKRVPEELVRFAVPSLPRGSDADHGASVLDAGPLARAGHASRGTRAALRSLSLTDAAAARWLGWLPPPPPTKAPGGWTLKEDRSLAELMDRYFGGLQADAKSGGRRGAAGRMAARVQKEADTLHFAKARFAVAVKS